MIDLRELVERIRFVSAGLAKKPDLRWATVTNASPLVVKLESDTTALAGAPASIAADLRVGDRVFCAMQGNRLTVLGRGGGNPARRSGLLASVPSGALAQIGTTGIYAVTMTFVVPAVAPPGSVIDVRATWAGTGWGTFQLTSQVSGVSTTTCTARFVQPGSNTQQSLTLIWEIIPVGN